MKFFLIYFAFYLQFSTSIAIYKEKDFNEIQLPYKIPSRYNFFDYYSYCNFFNNNNSCLGDYAQGIFLSISHRICKKTENPFKLSYQYLSACDPLSHGCEKGDAQSLIYFFEQKGVPSEENLPWEAITSFNASYCSKFENDQTNFYKISHGSNKILINIDQIQKEIFLYGPVSALISDFQLFEDENFADLFNEKQTFEIIGWEENEEKELSWIIFTEKLGQLKIRAELTQLITYSYEIYSTIE